MLRPANNKRSLRKRLLSILGFSVFSAMLIVTLCVLLYEMRSFQPRFEREVGTQLEVVGLNIQSALDFSDRQSALESLRTLAQDPRFLGATLFDREQQQFAQFTSTQAHNFRFPAISQLKLESEFSTTQYRAYSPIRFNEEVVGHIIAYYQLPPLLDRLPQYAIMVASLAVALLIVAGFLFIAVENLISSPVRELARRARRVSEVENSDDQLIVNNEIAQLEHDFEQMLLALDHRAKSMHENEERFRRLLEMLPVAIAVTTPDLKLFLMNHNFSSLTGYTPDELMSLDDWWPRAYPDAAYREQVKLEWMQRIEKMHQSGGVFEPYEATIYTKSGDTRTVVFSYAPMGDLGITSLSDISDRKRAEREVQALNEQLEERVRRRTSELEIANRELESFSYSVSHDLRAPLRAISGFGTALNADYRDKLDDDGQMYLDRMLAASTRMGQLIDDLLRFSRLSRTALQCSTVDMNELVMEVWSELKESLGAGIGEPELGALPACFSDRGLLKQVVFNLLNNAVKFSRHASPRHIEVFSLSKDGKNVYVVRDNGAGFNMDFSSKLFGVFQRLHRAEQFEGTGVGLALCRRVVERHGGQIWAESSEGQGAAFFFTIAEPESNV